MAQAPLHGYEHGRGRVSQHPAVNSIGDSSHQSETLAETPKDISRNFAHNIRDQSLLGVSFPAQRGEGWTLFAPTVDKPAAVANVP
jgi:hypothetical protein